MSMGLNRVLLLGNLTRDPTIRNTSGGTPYADFGVAINESYMKDGQKVEKAVFLDVVVWDRQATACGEYLQKGSSVFIEGKLQQEEWNDKESGAKRTKLKVRADRVNFLSPPRERVQQAVSGQDDLDDDLPQPRNRPANASPSSHPRAAASAR